MSHTTDNNTTSSVNMRRESFDFSRTVQGRSLRYFGYCQINVFWHARKSSDALEVVIEALEDSGSQHLRPPYVAGWNLQDISLKATFRTSGAFPIRSIDASYMLVPFQAFLGDQNSYLDCHPCTGKVELGRRSIIEFTFEKKRYTMNIVDITPSVHITTIERPDLPLVQGLVEALLASTRIHLELSSPSASVPNTETYGIGQGGAAFTWDWTINGGAPNRLTWAQSKTVLASLTTLTSDREGGATMTLLWKPVRGVNGTRSRKFSSSQNTLAWTWRD